MSLSITIILIGITCLVSFAAFRDRELFYRLSHNPYSVVNNNEYHRLITSAFVHGSEMHLFVNMFVLWMFGEYVEFKFLSIFGETMGRVNYLVLYLASAVFADLPITQRHKNNPSYNSIGASGATSAIVFVYVLFNPWNWLLLFFIIPIPAIVAAVLYVIYSSKMDGNSRDNINHSAHLWGAIAGVVITLVLKPSIALSFFDKLMDYTRVFETFPFQ